MPTSTLVDDLTLTAPASAPDAERGHAGGGRAWPVVAMGCGLVVLAVAAALVLRAGHGAPSVGATTPADPAAITLAARDVSVVVQEYAPGEHSGWHAHPGIHAVVVLEGTLTVYDGQCRPATFEPGRPYVGGQQRHLVRNEGDVPVKMVVTYLNPTGPTTPTEHLARPAGCTAG